MALLVSLVIGATIPVTPASAQTIVLVPNGGPRGAKDLWELFEPNAPWQGVSRHIQAVGVPIAGVPDDRLRMVFADLRRRHIGASIGMLPLTGADSGNATHCGFHVEGYSAAGETITIARRIKALGGTPSDYGMDEPLLYGHYYGGPNACHSTIADVARDVSVKVKQVRSLFPGIGISDAEPIMSLPDATWRADLAEWLDAFHAATGTPLTYLWLDMGWAAPWQRRLPALTALLHSKGVGLGVIYNGDGNAASDAAWVASAVAHYQAFETVLGHAPDGVAFQTWVSRPTHVLPESDPNTLTGLVARYLAWRASHP